MNNGDKRLSSAFQECSPSMVRNVCIIAHVDHGKTTLADFLVSANGIISARLAGKLRYMDSREDEQTRGITMKSSAITLYYEPLLLNLIDSPGHVDFCTEVSSAVNLADIALLLVDAVEGVCSQTESLIRQALTRKLDIILVLNKLDRLIVELKMSVAEAHSHLQRLIEFVNACISKTIQGQLLDEDWHTVEQIESQLHFNPSKGNVLFASALYGYAFTLEDFGQLWAKRLTARGSWDQQPAMKDGKQTIDEEINKLKAKLMPHLFSRDHYFVQKSGEICIGAEQKGKKTLFEQFVLEPIWEVHKCALIEKDIARLQQLASKLALPPLKAKRADEAFPELMRNWLPLSSTVVRTCAKCKSAQKAYQAGDGRLRELFIAADVLGLSTNGTAQTENNHPRQMPPLPSTSIAIFECNPANSKLIFAFVAKSFKAVDQRQQQRRISLCRVMSGTIKIEDNLYVLLKSAISTNAINGINCQAISNKCIPIEDENEIIKIDDAKNEENWRPIRVSALFMLLGRELIPVEKVPCGRICGIEVNNGSEWIPGPLLSSHPLSPEETPRLDANEQRKFAEPLVRVIIRPSNPGPNEFGDLRSALRQLAVLDSAVRILEPKENELVLLTAGEVHLQKCLEDLNALGQTELVVSEPIVPFLETIVPDPRIPISRIQTEHLTECRLRQFSLRIRIRAVPLAGIEADTKKLLELLQRNGQLIDSFREGILNVQHRTKIDTFRKELVECAKECLPRLKGSWWAKRPKAEIERLFADGILAFGPAKAKFNILFNNNSINDELDGNERNNFISVWNANLRPLEQAMVGGFHSAMALGPLCDEPMQSIGIVLEEFILENKEIDGKMGTPENDETMKEIIVNDMDDAELGENDEKEKQEDQRLHSNAQLHGQLISAFRQTCRAALKKHTGALRLLAAMYQCRVQTPEQALGKVQAVLAQKRAKVHSEEVNELSGLFEIGAYLPVVESFSFCEQLRKRSSGTASAQLEFTGWQLIDEDPYWEPSTEEEMEQFGGGGVIQQNQARQYMDAVRRRKGLATEDVIVVSAEKQRNLKRNK